MSIRFFSLFFVSAIFAFPHLSFAQQRQLQYSSGTGFFVSRNGHIVTNAHVVPDCLSITLGGAVKEEAKLIAKHPSQDLAILQTKSRRAPQIAPMRVNLRSLRLGDKLNIAGFPGDSGFRGNLVYAQTVLKSMNGPTGEPNFLEFHNSAQKGNSGGPLMDASGNVIGVVTGKAQVIQRGFGVGKNAMKIVKESDVAITLPYVRPFLSRHGVRFNIAGGGIKHNPKTIAQKAKKSIVHVRCLQGEAPAR